MSTTQTWRRVVSIVMPTSPLKSLVVAPALVIGTIALVLGVSLTIVFAFLAAVLGLRDLERR